MTAVWILEVVAPPIIRGILKPLLSISEATWTISSRDGVISPESATMSACSFSAVSRILSQGTITPRSMTSKPLHWNTIETMFFPMSCTSPFTVAITTLPALCPLPDIPEMNGSR